MFLVTGLEAHGDAMTEGKLTPAVQERICEMIRLGNFAAVSARVAGISEQTLYNWIKWGREQGSGPYYDFWKAVEQADADAEAALVAEIKRHAPNDWRASAEVLRRRYRRNWGDVVRQEISGPNGGPVEIVAESVTSKLLPELVSGGAPKALEHTDESGTGGAGA